MRSVMRRIVSVFILISIALIVMGAAPGINVTNPPNPSTVNVNFANVTVTTTGTTGNVTLNWNNINITMLGSGNDFYFNKTGLLNDIYTYIVYADDGAGNLSDSGPRTVTVSASPVITNFEPVSPTVTSNNGTEQKFNITVDQNSTGVSWMIDNNQYQNLPITAGAKSEFANSTTVPGTHNVTAIAANGFGSSSIQIWSWTVQTPALSQVTGLNVAGKGTTWINWTWTNPGEPFNHSIIKINGIFQTNTSDTFYNHTSLNLGTLYTISIQTVDTSGNVYPTPIENQSSTYNTQTGTNVPIQLDGNLKVVYSLVTTEGNTTVNPVDSLLGSETQPTFSKIGKYYYIGTEALVFNPPITIELNYTPPTEVNESNVRLYHWDGAAWNNETTFLDIANHRVIGSINSFSPIVVGAPPGPTISKIDPTANTAETTDKESKTFKITVDQDASIEWRFGTTSVNTSSVLANTTIEFTHTPSSTGTFNFSVTATNVNGTDTKSWEWAVRPKTFATGNRIWDANRDMSTTYTWSPYSFYAFYYDVDDNVGNESLQIILNPTNRNDRNVRADNLIYRTAAEEVTFKYDKWGKYNVIGFMAEKYFAGYTTSTNITDVDKISTLGRQQLHKVLKDDRQTFTVRASSTYLLEEGYSVTIKDVGAGREAMISILKDGGEVYTDFKERGETLVYSKRVGSINDLPIIILHIGNVFMGTTENMVQIDGIFQVSESYTSVNSRNSYGMMKIRTVSDAGIEMRNDNSFTLSSGSTVDIMGDMKFIVARNDSVLRFAPMVKKTGEYEVRGTISNNETDNLWTPLSFEGFYYNIDEDVGTESLTINRTGSSVGKDNIVYTTTATPVSHKYKGLGQYNVIGFMAEKYFAGYIASAGAGAISDKDISTISRNQLHKVLIDDDTQRVIYAGSTLTLNDGYVIKIKDVNMGAGTAEVWLSVLKDGNEVGDSIMEKGDVFKFEKDVGAVKELPIIALRIDNIFRGKEATAAFVKGTFQISESYKTVKQSDTFDKMKVDAVTANSITMKNPNTVSLDAGSSDTLMGKVSLKVADSSDIRFYPYILVNGSALSESQLSINVPSSMMVKDVISIQVVSGAGTPQDNAEVSFDGQVIGTTNTTGKLDYMLTKAGKHNFTATKLGYETAIKAVQIDEYVDNRLNFELPEFIDQYIPVSIKVKVSGTGNATSGANVTFDGTSIGTTDSNGILIYTFTSSGTHNLAASKKGYITVQREINVRLPFTEFKALDINFTPGIVARGQNVYVWANITNTGTKEGMLPVALMINSTVVENKNVTLAPGKKGEVNFSRKIELVPGNYSVEILNQKTTMPVREEPLNIFLVGGLITGIGAIAIFLMTSKDIISIEALKAKLSMGPATNKELFNRTAMDNALKNLMSKFQNK